MPFYAYGWLYACYGQMPRIKMARTEVSHREMTKLREILSHLSLVAILGTGLVPTAAAVANALYQFDGVQRTTLPMELPKKGRVVVKAENGSE